MGKNYVYACIYTADKKHFLIARKKQIGNYFQWRLKTQVLNFSGQDVLPGGGLKVGQDAIQGAKTEFKEETGIDILNYATLKGTHKFDYQYEVKGKDEVNVIKGEYHGVYFVVENLNELESLRYLINDNLELAQSEKIKLVEDDELNNMHICNADTVGKVLATFNHNAAAPGYKGQTDKTWFLDILNHTS